MCGLPTFSVYIIALSLSLRFFLCKAAASFFLISYTHTMFTKIIRITFLCLWCVLRSSLASTTIICLNICMLSVCVCFFGNACRLFLIYSFLDASFFMHDDNDEKKLYVMIQYYEYDLRSTRLLLSSVKLFQPVAITGGAFTSSNTISFLLSATVFNSQFVYSISFSIFHLALLATATTNQII